MKLRTFVFQNKLEKKRGRETKVFTMPFSHDRFGGCHWRRSLGFTLRPLSLTAWRPSAPSCVCALYWGPRVSGESTNYILIWQRETPPSVPLRSMHKNDGKILPLFSSSGAGERVVLWSRSHYVGIRKPQPSQGRKCGVVEKTRASAPRA